MCRGSDKQEGGPFKKRAAFIVQPPPLYYYILYVYTHTYIYIYTFCPFIVLTFSRPLPLVPILHTRARAPVESRPSIRRTVYTCDPPALRHARLMFLRARSCPNIHSIGKNPKENINICVCGQNIRPSVRHTRYRSTKGEEGVTPRHPTLPPSSRIWRKSSWLRGLKVV